MDGRVLKGGGRGVEGVGWVGSSGIGLFEILFFTNASLRAFAIVIS